MTMMRSSVITMQRVGVGETPEIVSGGPGNACTEGLPGADVLIRVPMPTVCPCSPQVLSAKFRDRALDNLTDLYRFNWHHWVGEQRQEARTQL